MVAIISQMGVIVLTHQWFHKPHRIWFSRPRGGPSANMNFYNASPNSFVPSNTSQVHNDKVPSIIQNWQLKFDGSRDGLHIEEFLYMLRYLTRVTFNNDFSVICDNFQILLTGKARNWYWRYHKNVEWVEWNSFCEAIRNQYRECKPFFDIREEIRNRKQKASVTFDMFFVDRLPRPMTEAELIEILGRNLRPEIR